MFGLKLCRPRIRRRTPWLPVLQAAVAGICADRYLRPTPGVVVGLAWGYALILVLARWLVPAAARWTATSRPWRTIRDRNSTPWVMSWLFLGILCLFAQRHAFSVRYIRSDSVECFLPDSGESAVPAIVRGRVVGVERIVDAEGAATDEAVANSVLPPVGEMCLEVELSELHHAGAWFGVSGAVRAWAPADRQMRVGRRVEICGMLAPLPTAANPGGTDWRAHTRGMAPAATLRVAHRDALKVLATPRGTRLFEWLAQIRYAGQLQLERYVPHHQHGLASAMILGLVRGIPPDVSRDFNVTGMGHMVSISGLHVGMLIAAMVFLMRVGWISLPTLRWAVVVCALYALLTGGRAPVVRACILAQCLCIGFLTRRPPHPWNTLAGSAVLLLYARPAELFQLGAQLSFLAVAGLGWYTDQQPCPSEVVDPLDRLKAAFQSPWRRWLSGRYRSLGRGLRAGLAVSCVTMPLTMWHFGVFSPWAAALNLLIAPPLFVTLVCGILVVLCGAWLPPVAVFCGWGCGKSLDVLCALGSFTVGLPTSHFWVLGPSHLEVLGFYVAWCLLANCLRQPLPVWFWSAVWCAWMAVVGAINVAAVSRCHHPYQLRCYFFSVGHGTCVLLKLPGGINCLYDAGQMGATPRHVQEIAGALRFLRVDRVHRVFLSHADVDHFNLLEGLMDHVRVDQVLINPSMGHSPSPMARRLQQSLAARRIPVSALQRGDHFQMGDVSMDVLHPNIDQRIGEDNAHSLVLWVQFAGRSILLPGDLEPPGLAYLVARPTLQADVAMAPHHGRGPSDVRTLCDWCSPRFVAISGRRTGDADELEQDLRSAVREPFHTARDGCVEFRLSDSSIDVRTWKTARRLSVRVSHGTGR